MHPGLTREQALTPLTEIGGPNKLAYDAPIADFEISPDGRAGRVHDRAHAVPARLARVR